jgi:hypothetical protein
MIKGYMISRQENCSYDVVKDYSAQDILRYRDVPVLLSELPNDSISTSLTKDARNSLQFASAGSRVRYHLWQGLSKYAFDSPVEARISEGVHATVTQVSTQTILSVVPSDAFENIP